MFLVCAKLDETMCKTKQRQPPCAILARKLPLNFSSGRKACRDQGKRQLMVEARKEVLYPGFFLAHELYNKEYNIVDPMRTKKIPPAAGRTWVST